VRKLILPLAALAMLCACGSNSGTSNGKAAAGFTAASNGKAMYLTGKDAAGFRIIATRPPLRTSCAACHRPNGAGGIHLPGGAVSADLRHKALAAGPHPFTQETVERAISTGIDNDGKPLNAVMPRWKMSARDLHDVAAYVMTL